MDTADSRLIRMVVWGTGDDDDSESPHRAGTRGTLPKQAVESLKAWLFAHFHHPYPTDDEKRQLGEN